MLLSLSNITWYLSMGSSNACRWDHGKLTIGLALYLPCTTLYLPCTTLQWNRCLWAQFQGNTDEHPICVLCFTFTFYGLCDISVSGFLFVDAQWLFLSDLLHDTEPTRSSQLVTTADHSTYVRTRPASVSLN